MSSSDDSSSSNELPPSQQKQLTASEMMRQKFERKQKITSTTKSKKTEGDVDIDDEIKRLEAELEGGSDSDSDSSSNSESDNDNDESGHSSQQGRRKRIRFGKDTILNPQDAVKEHSSEKSGEGVISISECATEIIAPLPKEALPTSKTKKLKVDALDVAKQKERRKRQKMQDDDTQVNEGLRAAVKEVLSGYVARSSEKIPFYCRVCSHQSENEEDFQTHKISEFHTTAVQVEKKATYCKLCRKQLTSLVQMKEHLDSRPHREKMDDVKARQRGWPMNNRPDREGQGQRGGRGRGSFQGRGRSSGRGGGRWQGRGPSDGNRSSRTDDKRQWC